MVSDLRNHFFVVILDDPDGLANLEALTQICRKQGRDLMVTVPEAMLPQAQRIIGKYTPGPLHMESAPGGAWRIHVYPNDLWDHPLKGVLVVEVSAE